MSSYVSIYPAGRKRRIVKVAAGGRQEVSHRIDINPPDSIANCRGIDHRDLGYRMMQMDCERIHQVSSVTGSGSMVVSSSMMRLVIVRAVSAWMLWFLT